MSRPNRFIANVLLNEKNTVCHVKNTGRCRELLIPGAEVFVQKATNSGRKTQFDLISVEKNGRLFNIDSQAPNKVFGEWIKNGGLFKNIKLIKPECRYKNSRFDFYIEADERKIFAEIKGVTLEENNVAMFPDAPTLRGVKHINELAECVRCGYGAYIVFVIQTENIKCFTPNRKAHAEFADALSAAEKNGVKVIAVDCKVTENEIAANNFKEVIT